jgi:hypothetical protein
LNTSQANNQASTAGSGHCQLPGQILLPENTK